jgi:hypothetical protein
MWRAGMEISRPFWTVSCPLDLLRLEICLILTLRGSSSTERFPVFAGFFFAKPDRSLPFPREN